MNAIVTGTLQNIAGPFSNQRNGKEEKSWQAQLIQQNGRTGKLEILNVKIKDVRDLKDYESLLNKNIVIEGSTGSFNTDEGSREYFSPTNHPMEYLEWLKQQAFRQKMELKPVQRAQGAA